MDRLPPSDAVDRALLDYALETSPGAFVSIDAAGRVTGWNHASGELFGWSAEEVLGRALAEVIVPPEHRADHLAGVARVAASGRSELAGRVLVLPGLTRAGERVPLKVTIWPSDGPDGPRFHAHLRDVRPEAASRQAVEHQQSRFERLARVVPGVVYIYVLDEDGEARYDYLSPACEELFGFTAEEAVADSSLVPRAVHPDDRDDFRRAQWISGAALEELAWTGRVVHRDGRVREVAVTASPALMPDGATEWSGVLLDRTEQAAAERTIAQQSDRLGRARAVLDAALATLTEAVVACDATGRVTYLNRAAELVHCQGVVDTADGLAATYDLVDPATGRLFADDDVPLHRALRGETVEGARVDVAPAGLPRRRLVANAHRLTSPTGELLGAVVSMRDLDTLVGDRAGRSSDAAAPADPGSDDEAPDGSTAASWRADRVTGELRGSLGRRVDQQLDAVRWGLEVAASADPGEEAARALSLVSRAVARLDALHRDVWSLVALETGRLVSRPRATAVEPLLRAAAALAQQPERVVVECGLDVVAWVQPDHLEQVLANLVANADEHAGGVTVLRAARAGEHVLVDVEDAGEGVPDARRAQLFQKLTRAGDPATAARGTALGLYVVRRLAEANHGAVAHQALARGSRFVVSLPAAPD